MHTPRGEAHTQRGKKTCQVYIFSLVLPYLNCGNKGELDKLMRGFFFRGAGRFVVEVKKRRRPRSRERVWPKFSLAAGGAEQSRSPEVAFTQLAESSSAHS